MDMRAVGRQQISLCGAGRYDGGEPNSDQKELSNPHGLPPCVAFCDTGCV
jgi:hypothetical protein